MEDNTAGGYDAFMASHTLQDAVLRNLQTMVESTQRLSPAVRAAAPSVDWTALSGFRNVPVHNDLGIDFDRIWTTIQQDVPTLKAALDATKHWNGFAEPGSRRSRRRNAVDSVNSV